MAANGKSDLQISSLEGGNVPCAVITPNSQENWERSNYFSGAATCYVRCFTSIVGRSMPQHTEMLLAMLLLSYHQVIELTNLLGNSV